VSSLARGGGDPSLGGPTCLAQRQRQRLVLGNDIGPHHMGRQMGRDASELQGGERQREDDCGNDGDRRHRRLLTQTGEMERTRLGTFPDCPTIFLNNTHSAD
jgi:hypothetical protein